MEFIENNAIAGAPTLDLTIYIFIFSNAYPLPYEIDWFKICKIYFIMILIRSQQNNSNTTVRLHYYDNRHL